MSEYAPNVLIGTHINVYNHGLYSLEAIAKLQSESIIEIIDLNKSDHKPQYVLYNNFHDYIDEFLKNKNAHLDLLRIHVVELDSLVKTILLFTEVGTLTKFPVLDLDMDDLYVITHPKKDYSQEILKAHSQQIFTLGSNIRYALNDGFQILRQAKTSDWQ